MASMFLRYFFVITFLTLSKQAELEVLEEVSEITDHQASDDSEIMVDSVVVSTEKSDSATTTDKEIPGMKDNLKPIAETGHSGEVIEIEDTQMTQKETIEKISAEVKEVEDETKSTEEAELDLSVHSETHTASVEKEDPKAFPMGTLFATVDNVGDISRSVVDLIGGTRVARFNRPVVDILQQGKNIVDEFNGRILQDVDQIRQFLSKQIFLRT